MYSIEGLTHGIERCDVNIATLEKAIEKERTTKADYRIMIDKLEVADRKMQHAKDNISSHVELVVDND